MPAVRAKAANLAVVLVRLLPIWNVARPGDSFSAVGGALALLFSFAFVFSPSHPTWQAKSAAATNQFSFMASLLLHFAAICRRSTDFITTRAGLPRIGPTHRDWLNVFE